jgi:hypothetical protein
VCITLSSIDIEKKLFQKEDTNVSYYFKADKSNQSSRQIPLHYLRVGRIDVLKYYKGGQCTSGLESPNDGPELQWQKAILLFSSNDHFILEIFL